MASITNGEVMWYLHDHLGGTNVLVDADAEVRQVIKYTPFGAESRNERFGLSPELAARYAFTNHYKDEKTGLIFMQARYYDPTVGRFLTPDTIIQ
ncbi:RHS repeat-associated core domain-containing protein, partial [Arthrospira platensis SPKY1]|nr:RHS repeat-associated core domain-containing protein [Arthrospira platensis SPKY1]